MVGPVGNDERLSVSRKLWFGFVLLVGLSAGLITLQTGAGPVAFVVALAGGSLLGVLLAWLTFPNRDDLGMSGLDERTRR